MLIFLIVILLCAINYYMILISRHKKYSFFKKSFEQVGNSVFDQKLNGLLFLNTADLIKIEDHIASLPSDWVIIFNGPEWLYKVKFKKWSVRVLHAPVIDIPSLRLMKDSFIVIREPSMKKDRYTIIYELREYIDFQLLGEQSSIISVAR
ncbi:hypothetical protein CXK86_26970 [Paenibacillus sp. BGI2013]|uniref:hypothetical protein n=1 Tax=Paenibacillus TaxID=44249 RepID=UPI00096ED7BC|nr:MULTISPECIES: hypothetical protein [Paenibacillus]OMF39938.1 hypothetical protein BK136_25415 [Paenibacillus amylolyticus]PKQ88096.1 hypothetical protein CXK86_26970 [Paenibacillus sp. BGI2013]